MKTPTLLLVAASLSLTSVAFASGQNAPANSTAPAKKDAKPAAEKCECGAKGKKVMLTGSRLPQRVTRVGRVTDSMHPVTVYSREDIDATGATDLATALRKLSPAMR